MAALAEDLTFGDFSELEYAEYHALFRTPPQSSSVEFPWDDKSCVRSLLPADAAATCSGEKPSVDQASFPSQPSEQSDLHGPPQGTGGQGAPALTGRDGSPSYHILPNNSAGLSGSVREEMYQNQWGSKPAISAMELKGAVHMDMPNQSECIAPGSELPGDEGTKKRRNKKRRDPDHYRRYYNSIESETSVSNENSTENGTAGIEPNNHYASSENYAPQNVPASKPDGNQTQNTAPLGSEYHADEKSTERTSVCEQYSTADPNNVAMPQTNNVGVDQPWSESVYVEAGPPYDVTKQMDGVEIVGEGNSVNINNEPVIIDVQPEAKDTIQSNTQIVPDVNASQGESTTPTPTPTPSEGEPAKAEAPEAAQTAPAAPAARPAIKSWASLFKGGSETGPSAGSINHPPVAISVTTESSSSDGMNDEQAVSLVSADKDPYAKKLGEHLSHVSSSHHPMNLQPRGLINTANWCYINSILQALLSCPPFYHLMRNLPLNNKVRNTSSTPMLDAMYQFLKEFLEMKGPAKRATADIRPGMPFEPTIIYQMLSVAQTSLAVKQGRQEDAEEFLSCLLNGLHDEMTSLIQLANGEDPQQLEENQNGPTVAIGNGDVGNENPEDGSDDNDEWEQVGPRNKTSITRRAQFSQSPLSHIFGGIMRSALHQHGSKESATLQPFFSLQLDIQSQDIWTVQHALDMLGNKESVHGFMSNKTKKEVEAFRRITLEELPPVLILHLKRFLYDKSGGCQKLMKKVEYGMELEISKDLISPNAKSRITFNQRVYKLFAVVYHTGKEASGGHYITDLYHVGTSGWLRCDDSIIKSIKPVQVTKPQSTYIPYLLFYRRRDLLTKPTAARE
ncbi:ubiquitin carboxyl-terminal hydrolase 10-A-like [Diadema antillarum]|uniref:ubiquitin carboxyl-terminal hydrolase 10-A-like n=1 Tax=Diadema antillarum TaxID=105358 RepID=UPI003A83BFEB